MTIEEPEVAATRMMRRRRIPIHMGRAGIEGINRIHRVSQVNRVAGQWRLGRHPAHVGNKIAVVPGRVSDIDIVEIALAPYVFFLHKDAQRRIQVRADGANAIGAIAIVVRSLRRAEKHFLVTHF